MVRIFRHLLWPAMRLRRFFSTRDLQVIEDSVRDAEHGTDVELRVCIEGALPWRYLFSGDSAHERAREVFCLDRVWDTENNRGVLLYVSLSEGSVEIVYDRGLQFDEQLLRGWIAVFLRNIPAGIVSAVEAVIYEVGAYCKKQYPEVEKADPANAISNAPRIL